MISKRQLFETYPQAMVRFDNDHIWIKIDSNR